MNRRIKRALIVNFWITLSIAAPVASSIVTAILAHTFFSWEGRAFLIIVIGVILSIATGISIAMMVDEHGGAIEDWIEEPEKEPIKPEDPKAGAWKES